MKINALLELFFDGDAAAECGLAGVVNQPVLWTTATSPLVELPSGEPNISTLRTLCPEIVVGKRAGRRTISGISSIKETILKFPRKNEIKFENENKIPFA